MISVSVVDEQTYVRLSRARIVEAVRTALESAGLHRARMTVALIDDAHIQELNRRFLNHDEPTDVLSFPMGSSRRGIEGEIVVSAQRASAVADQYGWTPEEELLLYIIHGALHLAGFDDAAPREQSRMRRQEALCLKRLGITIPSASKGRRRKRNRRRQDSSFLQRKKTVR
ncbi:MAG TPA: rRNA maturation RNase YbeY [Thermoguttaceae bacterium]|nr:rRNA maturation RNase YbeY [Thermoguttaceae bacterium]HPP54150.1 rRNA maturation RNase YbeY [Thermoguttaceae bacterium]